MRGKESIMTKMQSQTQKSNIFLLYHISISIIIVILIIFSKSISENIRNSIRLVSFSVVPSLFLFLIISDFISSKVTSIPFGKKISNIFSISEGCECAIICGLVCGFPCGVKYAAKLYENGNIGKEELERLIGLVNNPSIAFVVSAVGVGMLNSVKDGFLLYISVIISILLVAKCYKRTVAYSSFTNDNFEQRFNLSKSIKNAGLSSVAISSYIIFFSAALGVLKSITESKIIISFFASFLEIGNATSEISSSGFSPSVSFIFYGFALGFSGLSVHMQAFDLLDADISKRKYFKMKLTQGVFCAMVAFVLKLCTK